MIVPLCPAVVLFEGDDVVCAESTREITRNVA